MSTYYRGLIFGVVWAVVTTALCVFAYANGRASIVEQCLEHRAFTYGDGAWGCVRLKRRERQVYDDTIVQPRQGELM